MPIVNNDLAIIAEWLKVNKLSLNIKKHISSVFQLKTSLFHVYLNKLTGKPLQKLVIKIHGCDYWQQIELEKIISHLCVERSLVVSGL